MEETNQNNGELNPSEEIQKPTEESTVEPTGEQNPMDSGVTTFENRINLAPLSTAADQIRNELAKVVVGQNKTIDLLLTALLSDGHILLEGVPGVAKTLIAKLLARTISVDFSRIQFTPDLMPSDVIGTTVFNLDKSSFSFKKGPIFSNIVLIDEINRSPAKTQAALFEVMEERQITMDGETYIMDEPFIVIATQNPVEQEGTYQLPEAQRDRFIFKITVDYPTANEELEILKRFNTIGTKADLSVVKPVVNAQQLTEFKKLITQVRIEENLLNYIVKLIDNTRTSRDLFLGASPRASLAIMNSSKAYAALQGRDFVTPEDIQFVMPYVLNHRILLSPEKELEGATTLQVTKDFLKMIEVPR